MKDTSRIDTNSKIRDYFVSIVCVRVILLYGGILVIRFKRINFSFYIFSKYMLSKMSV